MRRAGVRGVWLCLALAAQPAAAQQFDNFGDGPIQGFEMPSGGLQTLVPPSAGDGAEGNGLAEGDDISLRPGIAPGDTRLEVFPGMGGQVTSVSRPETAPATRVTLRALDRMLGQPTDIELSVGETVIYGRIAIHVRECRFPVQDPFSDAFGLIEVLDLEGNRLFEGWMVASSPALNALEHPRYDVWVLRCTAE